MATIKMAIGKIEVMAKSFHSARHYHLTDNLQVSVYSKSSKYSLSSGTYIHYNQKSIFKTGTAFFTALEFRENVIQGIFF